MRLVAVLSFVVAALVLTGTFAYLSWESDLSRTSGGAIRSAPTFAPAWLEVALVVIAVAVAVLSIVELRRR